MPIWPIAVPVTILILYLLGKLLKEPCDLCGSEGNSNLLVAGRCISVDHRVHHATKEIPPCMATGEAAGTRRSGRPGRANRPRPESRLDVKKLQRQLEARGAILRL